MISRADFDEYSRQVDAISRGASEQVTAQVLAWCRAHPDASVAEIREAAKEILSGVSQVYDEAAASLAAEWYDDRATESGARLPVAVTVSSYSSQQVDRTVRHQARALADGDVHGFAQSCGDMAEYAAKRSVNSTILANAARDRRRGVRFARVPTGAETCSFCLMLASRGAVYHTRKTAGEQDHFHRHCDCKIVPCFEDDPDAEVVEGYDPEALYSDYLDGKLGTFANKKRGGGSRTVSRSEAYRRMGEFNDRMRAAKSLEELYAIGDEASAWFKSLRFSGDKRSREQARDTVLAGLRSVASRRQGELVVGGKPGIVTYTKPRSELLEHERAGVDYLARHGFDVETIPEVGDAPSNRDVTILGEEWEMKNVTNAESSVSNQIKRARIKWYKRGDDTPMRCVFTCEGCTDSFDDVLDGIRKRMRDGERAIVFSQDGDIAKL